MRISVFRGPNGLTGRTLVKQALAAGHEVVACDPFKPAAFPVQPRPCLGGCRKPTSPTPIATLRPRSREPTRCCPALGRPRSPASRSNVCSDGVHNHRRRDGPGTVAKRIAGWSVQTAVRGRTTHADGGFPAQPRDAADGVRKRSARARTTDMRADGKQSWRESSPRLDDCPARPACSTARSRVCLRGSADGPLDGGFHQPGGSRRLPTHPGHRRPVFVDKVIEVTTSEGAPTLFQMIRPRGVQGAK